MLLEQIENSPSLEMVNLVLQKAARGEKVLSLAIGEPTFETPKEIVEAAYASMKAGEVRYTSSYGTSEVRDAVRRKVNRKNGLHAGIENTIFSTTKLSVYASLLTVSETGCEIMMPDPGYFYREPIVLAGGTPVSYRLRDDFSLDIDSVKRAMSKKTRAIVMNTPANPTGKVFEKSELAELYELCRERGVHIVADEAYEDCVYGKKHFSIGSLEDKPDIVISLFSLSKSYAMTGWRAGYVVASERIVYLINKFFENTLTCFPPFIQKASAFALDKCDGYIEKFRSELERRKRLLEEEIASVDKMELGPIEGALYAFPRLLTKIPSREITKRLLDKTNVAVQSGTSFGDAGEAHLRISFSGDTETIKVGTGRIRGFFAELRD